MRCHCVQALWATHPPQHEVVCVVACENPFSLWTGGIHGDIIHWKLHPEPPDNQDSTKNQELWPVALLCGHTAPIVAFTKCRIDEGKEMQTYTTGASVDEFCEAYTAVMSLCTEGWLCAWDSLTGRCQRRRRLPPWTGSPCVMTVLPEAPKYAAIACDSSMSSLDTGNNDGGSEIRRLVDNARTLALEKSGSIKKNIRGTVVIIDCSTLSVLQVVYNGFLGIGPVKSILALPEGDLHKVMLSDCVGRVRSWDVTLGRAVKRDPISEELETRISFSCDNELGLQVKALSVSISPDGLYILLVFLDHWVVMTRDCEGSPSESPHLEGKLKGDENYNCSGGFFLVGLGNGTIDAMNLFIVWDSMGSALLYCLQNTHSQGFAAKEICLVPPAATDLERGLGIKYYQLKDLLICVGCTYAHGTPISKQDTWVSLWILPLKSLYKESHKQGVRLRDCSLVKGVSVLVSTSESPFLCGEGGLRAHWESLSFCCPSEAFLSTANDQLEAVSFDTKRVAPLIASNGNITNCFTWVTASLLLFDRATIPMAFVLGFNQGEIRIRRLHIFSTPVLGMENVFLAHNDGCVVWRLCKHTAAITCLAEHSVSTEGKAARRCLLSGGLDCLVCVWDLEKGDLLAAFHPHVTPVRQILLPPSPGTDVPWSNCFVTVGEDGCMALMSLETLLVERMLVGHPCRPKMIVWDGTRGYLSCLCTPTSGTVMANDVLFIWDLKSGALERVLRGTAAHSMFDNFAKQVQGRSAVGNTMLGPTTSISTLLHGDIDSPRTQSRQDISSFRLLSEKKGTGSDSVLVVEYGKVGAGINGGDDETESEQSRQNSTETSSSKMMGSLEKLSSRITQALNQGTKTALPTVKQKTAESGLRNLFHNQPPIRGASPFPGVAALQFDLFTLMAPDLGRLGKNDRALEQIKVEHMQDATGNGDWNNHDCKDNQQLQEGLLAQKMNRSELVSSLGSSEGSLLRTSLAFLHLWGADLELDHCLEKELQISHPKSVGAAAGFAGDRGATTLLFPGRRSDFELWNKSPEFCALRSLTIVATALRMTTLSRLTSNASSALAAFYTRGLAEKFPTVKAPSLELYACFWQDPSEHIRMAARSLFHCAASRAIPPILSAKSISPLFEKPEGGGNHSESKIDADNSLLKLEQRLVSDCQVAEKATWPESVSSSAEINDWIDSFEKQSWTAVIGGTNQDARAGRIIVAAALAVWYPGLVKLELAPSVAPYLVKLVKAAVDRHSAVAAELLADGMESVWKHLLAKEIPHLMSDIFLLIDCLSGGAISAKSNFTSSPATAMTIRETLTGSLLPCLALVDVGGFLQLMQAQLGVASTDSSIHKVALMTIIRIIRGAPRTVVYHLAYITSIILQSMHCGKHCHQTAMAAVREMVRVYPMVALHQNSGKLAVGDAVGDVHSLAVQVYDLHSASKLRVLDASGPPGHPALLTSNPTSAKTGGISALTFSEDGEGVVAFSQHGLIIRWWSFNAVWWEKLSRVTIPVQCNKLVLVPPWAGFSPKSSRASMMETIANALSLNNLAEEPKGHIHEDAASRAAGQMIDLSFKLEWITGKKVLLTHHGQELGLFQL